jgi:hypothetical protein
MDPNYRAMPSDWSIMEGRATQEGSSTAARALLELRARIEALEAAQQPAPPAPAGGLVEWVAKAMGPSSQASMDAGDLPYGSARAAIREVAAWLRSELISRAVADRLDQEAER